MLDLPSLIFIDGGDPDETTKARQMLGHIDGQTTNPTLVAKNPEVMRYLVDGKKLTQEEALNFYKKIVIDMAKVTSGPISIQVIGDQTTSKDDMLAQARIYKDWIPNGIIKFPCTSAGLAAAEIFCQEWSVNITLNFSQEQAAAVYVATKRAKHRVFISPFVGRLDDRGENGMDVVKNILQMYHDHAESLEQSRRVEVLTASLRRLSHLLYALFLKSPAITVPFKIFTQWQATKFVTPMEQYKYEALNLKLIPYQEIVLDRPWQSYDLHHDLTDAGLTKFMEDWRSIIK